MPVIEVIVLVSVVIVSKIVERDKASSIDLFNSQPSINSDLTCDSTDRRGFCDCTHCYRRS